MLKDTKKKIDESKPLLNVVLPCGRRIKCQSVSEAIGIAIEENERARKTKTE